MTKYLLTAVLLCATPSYAEVRLPKVLASQMVLQRESEVKIWGWAEAGESVEVRGDWLDGKFTATADTEGRWQVQLQTNKAGGPHTITIEGENRIELRDVLFGEVWIASGQSNMEMPLVKVSNAYTGIKDADKEVDAANYPDIRLFQAGNFSSKELRDDVQPGIIMYGIPPAACRWQACTPKTIPTFSSTAYFFARQLHKELEVPIGIIDASWGGTSAEAWTPAEGLKRLGYDAELERAANLPQKPDQKIPTRLYNGMIHPLRHLAVQGVVWYQGEGNAGRADEYLKLFSTMIGEWRRAFGKPFSFYFVQIAPYNYRGVNAAYLREAQLKTMSTPGTGMAVTMDIGNLQDIHPKNKQEVGRRLALWALAQDYNRNVVYSGPVYRQSVVEGDKMRIKFEHVAGGLATRDNQPPSHFEIAGSDKVFHPAAAVIEGNDLVVSSPKVSSPKAVRFAFTSDATPNLMNKDGLPSSSFRTDAW
jgi:sialate O-acetylesterase